MLRAARAICLIFPLLAHAADPAPGKNWWGVVVGVGEYPQLGPSVSLEGPPNDVPLVMTWLARGSVPRSRITVLADHVKGADALPTRAAILAALDAVAARAAPGDSVFLYFAGHGSQVPQSRPGDHAKSDGLEEVFLPRDTEQWNPGQRRIPGAIRGSEIGQRVTAMRARGIFVWLVFDSCHSATMSRSAALVGLRQRALPIAALGVPQSDQGTATAPAPLLRISDGNLPGGYVAFYAAQTTEVAPELPLPAGEPDRRVHGLFTFALLKSIAAGAPGSYRDLSHQILAFYAVTYPRTTPEFEGALDLPIGASAATTQGSRTWPARNSGDEFEIAAGRLNDITPGTLLALTGAPAHNRPVAPLGVLRVTRSTLTTAWAQGVSDAETLRRWRVPQDLTAESGSGLVRVLQSNLDLTIRVAALSACSPTLAIDPACEKQKDSGQDAALARVQTMLARPGVLPAGMELVRDPSAADLLLLVTANRIHIRRASSLATSASRGATVDLEGADLDSRLQRAMLRAARVVGLVRLGTKFSDPGDELAVELRSRDRSGQWRAVNESKGAKLSFDAELAIRLRNIGPGDIDVTVLSIDDEFQITPIFPVDLETNRMRQGSAQLEVRGWARPSGPYQILVISEPAIPGKPHDLSYLAQPGVTRSARDAGFGAVLESIGFERRKTRSSADTATSGRIRVLGYEVLEGNAPPAGPAR
jgi:caspase domain-containing protein